MAWRLAGEHPVVGHSGRGPPTGPLTSEVVVPGARVGVVFVHGFLSSPNTWSCFDQLIGTDPELADVDRFRFGYASPPVSLNPLRRIPNVNDVAEGLGTYLRTEAAGLDRLVLVSHSQGGLVVQRFLARTLAEGRGPELAPIRRIVMFACPNQGSQIVLLLRQAVGSIWRNPQERDLRPLTEGIADAQRIVLNQVVHGRERRIPVVAFAGASDGVVTPTSARGVFPETGVLPGDHFSIIQPDSHGHPSYTALKRELLVVLRNADGGAGEGDVPAEVPAGQHSPALAATPAPAGVRLSIVQRAGLVDKLLAVPRMSDPTFRHAVYDELPGPVTHQLSRDGNPRTELFGLVRTFEDYPHLAPWAVLTAVLDAYLPEHPAVTELRNTLAGLRLVART